MVFAHQGGWDELLLVLAPVLVIVLLLGLAKRRADALHAQRHAEEQPVGRDADDVTG
jgi:hypothetical protein